MREVIEFIINTLGIFIIWHLVLKNKEFKFYSKNGLYTFFVILIAVTLIKIKL